MNATFSTFDPVSAKRFATRCKNNAQRWTSIAYGISGNVADAEDIVQQAVTIAIEKGGYFETDANFSAWVSQIVRNCALNFHRKRNRRKTYTADPVVLETVDRRNETAVPIDQSTGELLAMQGSFDDNVQSALQQLPSNARCCLLLRVVEQLSYREISKLMNIKEGTAMNLVHRSKKKLREMLENDFGQSA